MKRFPISRALVTVLLLGVLVMLSPAPLALAATSATLVTTSASSASYQGSGPPPQVYTCLGTLAFTVGAALLDKELKFSPFTSAAQVCIDAAVAYAFPTPTPSPFPIPPPSSPTIDILSSPSEGALSGSVQSAPVQNCTDNWETLQFGFYVRFKMIVGPPQSQEEFYVSPSSSTDDALIAQQLFAQYSGDIASKTHPVTSGPSQPEVYNIPPHSQVTFTLPITQYYKSGLARVIHPDGSTVILPWFFTDGYQQAGSITYTMSSC